MNFEKLNGLYHRPLFALISQSRAVHLEHWRGESVQRCSLLSIKTGGCSEDCAYCAQSAHYTTGVEREDLLPLERILSTAKQARAQGATRFCMGAAWRGVRDGTDKFERVLETVREVSQLGMEVCVTLGEIGDNEAAKLKAAGVTAYNHNIDTSPDFYPQPESVPINCLMAMPGTPLADAAPVDIFELVRLIAVARIAIPRARVRLAAGRTRITREGQALCFFAGANSIFFGDKLLTA